MATIAHTWMNTFERSTLADTAPADVSADLQALFTAHATSLYRFCRASLGQGGDAEDVVQETFLKLLQHLQAGGDRSNLRAWLFAVAANGCRDRARWKGRWRPWRAELDQRPVDLPADDPLDRPKARAGFARLAPRDRRLLALRAEGLSYRQMAETTGIAEASIGRLLARAVARWKKATQ